MMAVLGFQFLIVITRKVPQKCTNWKQINNKGNFKIREIRTNNTNKRHFTCV